MEDTVQNEVVPCASATLKYARISSRKVKIVADLIRGKDVDEALATTFELTSPTVGTPMIRTHDWYS